MKGQWESNINVWFPFMYSQKGNRYFFFQNIIKMFCLPVPTLIYSICEKFIYFQDRSVYSTAGKYVDRSWEYINRSQPHECGNWDWGRAIPRKGIHKGVFLAVQASGQISKDDVNVFPLSRMVASWPPGSRMRVMGSLGLKQRAI